MATKISQLPTDSAVTGVELLTGIDGATNKNISVQQIADFANIAAATDATTKADAAEAAANAYTDDAVAGIEGGGGVSTFAALTDKATVDIPTINTPTATALTNAKSRANHTGTQAATTITEDSTHRFATDAEKTTWNAKQVALVSGTNIKTINGTSVLGSGDIVVSGEGSGSPQIISLLEEGIPDDADLDMFSTTFGTDGTAAIQAILDTASAANPLMIIWDTHTSVTGLRVKSYTWIQALGDCGAILRDGSGRPILQTYSNQVLALTDKNIKIIGGIWNGNRRHSAGGAVVQALNSAYGNTVGLAMNGVENLEMRNFEVRNTTMFHVTIMKAHNVLVENFIIEAGEDPQILQDGLDVGSITWGRFNKGYIHCGDDHLVIAADALSNYAGQEYYSGMSSDCEYLFFDQIHFAGGKYGIRGISTSHKIKTVRFTKCTGFVEQYFSIFDNYPDDPLASDDPGPGYFEDIMFDDINIRSTLANDLGVAGGLMGFQGQYKGLHFRKVNLSIPSTATTSAGIAFNGASSVFDDTKLEGTFADNRESGNISAPVYVNQAHMKDMNFIHSRYITAPGSSSTNSKLLLVATGSVIDKLNFDDTSVTDAEYVMVCEGSIGQLTVNGLRHETAITSGGSLNITGSVDNIAASNSFTEKGSIISGNYGTMQGDNFIPLTKITNIGDTTLNLTHTASVLSETGGVWTIGAAASNGYGNMGTGASNITSGSDGQFLWYMPPGAGQFVASLQTGGGGAVFGSLAGAGASFDIATGNISVFNNTTLSTNVAVVTSGYYYRFFRNGATGQIKLQKSLDKGAWSDVYTFSVTSTATLTPTVEFHKDPGAVYHGLLYYPTIIDGTVATTFTLGIQETFTKKAYNQQTGTTYTLDDSDHGKTVILTNAAAITLTVPAGLPMGFFASIIQGGAGTVTITPSSTTVTNAHSFTDTFGRGSKVDIISTGVFDNYITVGDMA